MAKKENSSEIFNHGYVCGYNQCRVDKGEISQKQADEIMKKWYQQRFVFR